MTLAVGDQVVKLDTAGAPLTTSQETYIEYVVEEVTSPRAWTDGDVRVLALLRVVE